MLHTQENPGYWLWECGVCRTRCRYKFSPLTVNIKIPHFHKPQPPTTIASPSKMEIIHDPPKAESFTPLATYQSQTPESFFSGPPVLYHHSPSATLSLHKSDLESAPILSRLAEGAHKTANGTSSSAVNGNTHHHEEEEDADDDEEISIPDIDIWVTSE